MFDEEDLFDVFDEQPKDVKVKISQKVVELGESKLKRNTYPVASDQEHKQQEEDDHSNVISKKLKFASSFDMNNNNNHDSLSSTPATKKTTHNVRVADDTRTNVDVDFKIDNTNSIDKSHHDKPKISSSTSKTTNPTTSDKTTSGDITTSTFTNSNDTSQEEDTSNAGNKQSLIKLTHQVRHQVAIPNDFPYVPISQHVRPEKPARTYPFTLDPFQEMAICSIERGESVLVSAHTSAGKTVVAEYAIAQSLRDKQRVIYTSPIKALSNQKYRELSQEFGDVGLMTGDVTINPSASCLVMTTEILRSMLYRGSEVMREVAWVIFDEIHYMRDKYRGVVWEETIILLPDKVHYVFLSATIPNAMQFAEWICHIHKQPCHVVYTDFRPTPLQHYLFPSGGDGIHLAVDEKGQFREENFQRAISSLQDKNDNGPKSSRSGGGKGRGGRKDRSTQGPSDLFKIIRMIMVKNYHPVIVFSFAKKECESNALQLSKLDFNDSTEKDMVQSVFQNAIHSLNEEDRKLPQIEHILPLLKRGIGIHHSGLLPILKEVIEILFQEGLLKVLFATETFSIGLNMPAKTVVFTAVRKWDGKEHRWLGGGEYIQMSGRAGRRGLDDRGIVILMIDEKMEPAVAKGMLKGEADRLNSAFHLTYAMILNLVRVEGISPEYMLERNFYQFQSCAKVPELERDLQILEDRKEHLVIENEIEISVYHELKKQFENYENDIRDVVSHPTYCLPYLNPGRLVSVKMEMQTNDEKKGTPVTKHVSYGWGVIVNFHKKPASKSANDVNGPKEDASAYVVDVLLQVAPGTDQFGKVPLPCPPDIPRGDITVMACSLTAIDKLSSVRVFLPKDIKSQDGRTQVQKTLQEVAKRFKKDIPLLDPIKDMGIKDEAFVKLIKKSEVIQERLSNHALHNSTILKTTYESYILKQELISRIKQIKRDIIQTQSIIQLDELKYRKRVLRRLGYIDENDVIDTKGRVACEITAGDELLLTEMMFQGVFNDLTVEQTVSLLSCFTWQENSDSSATVRPELQGPIRTLKELATRIARVSKESKLDLDEEEYVNSFRAEMMDVVYAWCHGSNFSTIMTMTDAFEGSIIRCMRNLEELLRQMCAAAKAIGNDALETKFAEGINKIKRDIVFAASLYL